MDKVISFWLQTDRSRRFSTRTERVDVCRNEYYYIGTMRIVNGGKVRVQSFNTLKYMGTPLNSHTQLRIMMEAAFVSEYVSCPSTSIDLPRRTGPSTSSERSRKRLDRFGKGDQEQPRSREYVDCFDQARNLLRERKFANIDPMTYDVDDCIIYHRSEKRERMLHDELDMELENYFSARRCDCYDCMNDCEQ